jgi:hypothetical protein
VYLKVALEYTHGLFLIVPTLKLSGTMYRFNIRMNAVGGGSWCYGPLLMPYIPAVYTIHNTNSTKSHLHTQPSPPTHLTHPSPHSYISHSYSTLRHHTWIPHTRKPHTHSESKCALHIYMFENSSFTISMFYDHHV